MEEALFIDDIYEVVIGNNPKGGMTYRVGKVMGPLVVTNITYDNNAFINHGIDRILIYAKSFGADDSTQKLWKVSQKQPATITLQMEINAEED